MCVFYFIGNENVFSQKLNCCCDNIVPKVNEKEIFLVYNDYNRSEIGVPRIILIDYYKKDTFNIYRVTESDTHDEILEIIFKKPDCYVNYDTNIVYVYPLSYYQQKDTLWLNTVFEDTKTVLNYPIASVSWANDSVISLEKILSFIGEIHPDITEYIISNGKIIKKTYCNNMLFPDLYTPKGVKTFRSSVCR